MNKVLLLIVSQFIIYFYGAFNFFYNTIKEPSFYLFESSIYTFSHFISIIFPIFFLICHKNKKYRIVLFSMIGFIFIKSCSDILYFYLEYFRFGRFYNVAFYSVIFKICLFIFSIKLYCSKYINENKVMN